MSGLEAAAAPVLTALIVAAPIALTEERQTIIARWVALKIMVTEHNNRDNWVTPRDERSAFMNALTLPVNIHIWIGHCGLPGCRSAFRRDASQLFRASEPRPARKTTQTVTIGFGALLIHVFHSTIPDLKLYHFDMAPELLLPIHPFVREHQWPPRARLTLGNVRSIIGGLQRAESGPGFRKAC